MDTNQANKLKLFFLLTAVIVPITLATWYFGKSAQSGVASTTNKGELVIPVIDLVEMKLVDGDGMPAYQTFDELTAGVSPEDYDPRPWQLIYIGANSCDSACVERLYYLRQLHTRLGADALRVQGVYVQAAAGPRELKGNLATVMQTDHPGMRILFADPTALSGVLARTAREGEDPLEQHYIYVADPVGNVMLYFTPENTPEEILSDLEKLLKQSSLG